MTPSTSLPSGASRSLRLASPHAYAAATSCCTARCDLVAGVPLLAVHAATSAAPASAVAGRSQPYMAADVRIYILHHAGRTASSRNAKDLRLLAGLIGHRGNLLQAESQHAARLPFALV